MSTSSAPAAQVIGDFEVLGKLGQGGMGAVYRARQISLDRQVALKLLPSTLEADPDFVSRFQREARVAASLSHANLVKVYASGAADGTHFIAMELIEGETLGDLLKRGAIEPNEALRICADAARALDHGWQKARLVHRDIKPGNIFLSRHGDVKVGDLGLAKTLGGDTTGLTQTGTAMGTPHYVSPEQARGDKDLDFRADIYSLGCTLFQMLTGRTPYEGRDPVSVMHQHIHGPVPAILKVMPGCPIPLARLVGKMLKKGKHERQASYGELLAQIEQVRAIFAPAESPLESTLPPDPDSTLLATPAHTPRSATPVGQAPRLPGTGSAAAGAAALQSGSTAKSKLPLYGAIAAGVVVLGAVAFFAWPKPEKLTKAELYAKQREAERVAATASPNPVKPAAVALPEPAAIRLWDSPEKVSGTGRRWEDNAMRLDNGSHAYSSVLSRDAAIRAQIRMNPDAVGAQLCLRVVAGPRFYRMIVFPNSNDIALEVVPQNGATGLRLGTWKLDRPYASDEWLNLEFRAVGEELTVYADGKVLGTVRDGTINQPGGIQVFATKAGYFRDIEYIPLDGVSASPTTDNWQPLIDDGEWRKRTPGRAELEDGLLHLTRHAIERPQTFANGAIRARIAPRKDTSGTLLIARRSATEGAYRLGISSDRKYFLLQRHSSQEAKILASRPIDEVLSTAGESRVLIELRVENDRLTGLVNDVLVLQAQDATVKGPGTWGIYADDGWFDSVEVQPLAAASTEPWQDMLRGETKLTLGGGIERTADGLRFTKRFASAAVTSTGGAQRDGALRIRTTYGGVRPAIALRDTGAGGSGYRLAISETGTAAVLWKSIGTGQPSITLQRFALPRTLQAGEDYTLELRIVGTAITAKFNGELLGSVTDNALKEGKFAIVNPDEGAPTLIKSVEFLDLDAPAAEPWQDVLRDPAKLVLFQGIERRPEGLRVTGAGSVTFSEGPKRDGAVRMRAVAGGLRPALRARETENAGQYQLVMINDQSVLLNRWEIAERKSTILKTFPLREPLQPGAEYELELRVVGETLVAKFNREVLGTATDATFREGRFGLQTTDTAGAPTLVKSLEVLDLDAPIAKGPTAEGRQEPVSDVGLLLSSKSWQWITVSIAEGEEAKVFGPVEFRLDGSARGLNFIEKWEPAGPNRFKVHNRDRQKFWLFELSADRKEARTVPGGTLADAKVLRAIQATPLAATKDAPFVNSLGMKFVPVPITGGPTDGQRVLFSIWETRVQDYEVFAKETQRSWVPVGFDEPRDRNRPANRLSWEDAAAFCLWLTDHERRAGRLSQQEVYRLPSDHEWSCAVGIGNREDANASPERKYRNLPDVYPWGGAYPPPAGAGNYAGLESGHKPAEADQRLTGYRDEFVYTAPVGRTPANALGLYDLGGNVWEWCQDWFNLERKAIRVARGGSYLNLDAGSLSSASRPGSYSPDYTAPNVGFRVVLAPTP